MAEVQPLDSALNALIVELHLAGASRPHIAAPTFDAQHPVAVVPRRDLVPELEVDLGRNRRRVTPGRERGGHVDQPVHPAVVVHLADVLLGEHQQQLVDRTSEDRDRPHLHAVAGEEPPEGHRRARLAGDQLLDLDR